MDTSPDTPTPEEVAEAIADAAPVDWQACEASEAWKTAQLDALKQVEAVAVAFRAAADATSQAGSPDAARVPLFIWGSLEVLEKLGEGSFGEVFRARDPVLDRDVALKLHHPAPARRLAERSDFIAEARRLARIRHPNVVVVHGVDEHDGRTGLTLDLIDGRTLAEVAAETGPMSPGEAIAVGLDLCAALAAVHGAGLIHADIKPANVMREHGGRIVLMDFGAGVDLSPDRPTGAVCGTPAVMAPELLRGETPSPASDLYSLGVLLYYLLSGHYPVEKENLSEFLASQHRGESIPLADRRPDVPEDLLRVIERALDPSPARRFTSAGELRRALSRVASGVDGPTLTLPPSSRTTLLRVAAAILVGSAGLAGGTLAIKGLVSRSTSIPPAKPTARTLLAASPFVIEASFFRNDAAGPVALSDRHTVQPGERLFLTVAASEDLHLYVLNEDRNGDVFVLFPVPGLSPGNPLPAQQRNRLPGEAAGYQQDWVVTSAGGEERFLLIAARRPLPELEVKLAHLQVSDGSHPILRDDTPGLEQVAFRGVGGLAASASSNQSDNLLQRVRDRLHALEQIGEVWMDELVLENPPR